MKFGGYRVTGWHKFVDNIVDALVKYRSVVNKYETITFTSISGAENS